MSATRRSGRNHQSSSSMSLDHSSPQNGATNHASRGRSSTGHDCSRRKRHRRAGKGGEKHRRKWKPYDKLSWEEKLRLGEKEAISAEKKREEALRQGHPVAPFNTTQFIMEEHSGGKGITPRMVANRSLNASGNCPSTGSGFCSQQDTPIRDDMADDADDVYFEREYTAALESVRTERLLKMNAEELRTEVLRLEVEIDTINKNNLTQMESKDAEIAQLKKEIARQQELLTSPAEASKADSPATGTSLEINSEPHPQNQEIQQSSVTIPKVS